MKLLTFVFVFILTVCIVFVGIVLFPDIFGQAVTQNNEFVFGLFLGPFCVLFVLGWLGEKLILKLFRKTN
jgi:hypothetical protein